MWDLIVLAWPIHRGECAARVRALEAELAADADWALLASASGLRAWTRGATPRAHLLPNASGFIVGDLFDDRGRQRSLDLNERESAAPRAVARRLVSERWGGYLAFFSACGLADAQVLRDPSGERPCCVWRLEDDIFVAATDVLCAPGILRPRLALDWDRISVFAAAPSTVTEPLFEGVEAVAAGSLRAIGERPRTPEAIWRPDEIRELDEASLDWAAGEFVQRLDLVTGALLGPRRALVAEVSGGLDSATVAASIVKVGFQDRVHAWLNYRPARREGDEVAFARAVTERLGVELTAVPLTPRPLDEAYFAAPAGSFWPAINGLDVARDGDTAARLRQFDCDGLVSGQGGDAVFFQMPTPLLAAEEVQRVGLRAVGSPVVADLARRMRRSIWAVLADARGAGRSARPLPPMTGSLLTPEVAAASAAWAHPWMSCVDGLSPARQLQVQSIANCELSRAESRRRAAADLIFPLLAQPVVELGLSIPLRFLAGGLQDRAFARAAFRARLPQAVLARRSKGSFAGYYGRWAAANVPFLRSYLLDGCLCDAGVLDRDKVEELLHVEALIRTPKAPEVLTAAVVEGWVRHWQGRVPDSAPRR